MSQSAPISADWITALPKPRGKLLLDVTLADICWFRVGGTADVVFMPADEEDLAQFLKALPEEVPVHVLGAGSNTLIRDGGVRGVVVRLGAAFGQVTQISDTELCAGAATLDVKLARSAADVGLSGLEFYRGIPGAVGGAIAMNAGAYGGETSHVLTRVEALDRKGARLALPVEALELSYRHNGYDGFIIYTHAHFKAQPGDKQSIIAAMEEISGKREDSQPIKAHTGGSTFKNPGGAAADGLKAWKLIDAAGGRGLQIGGAQMSPLHCNFMINHGSATAQDLETLGDTIRRRVLVDSKIDLQWEIRRIGEAL